MLHLAVKNDLNNVVKALIETGNIDINAQNKWEQTALQMAIEAKNENATRILQWQPRLT